MYSYGRPICSIMYIASDRATGAFFYVAKVQVLEQAAMRDGTMIIFWYWPKMPLGQLTR